MNLLAFFFVDKYAMQQQCRWPLRHWYFAVPVYGFKKLNPMETSEKKEYEGFCDALVTMKNAKMLSKTLRLVSLQTYNPSDDELRSYGLLC